MVVRFNCFLAQKIIRYKNSNIMPPPHTNFSFFPSPNDAGCAEPNASGTLYVPGKNKQMSPQYSKDPGLAFCFNQLDRK